MKKKIFYSATLILFLALFIFKFKEMKLFIYNELGNKAQIDKKYDEARSFYNEALKAFENQKVRNNLLTNEYEAKNYKTVTETPSVEKYFIQGNSFVKLAEEKQDQKEIMENYQKALDFYKKAMNLSDDINIKKNYEIIQKRIDDMKQEQQQEKNQEDQQNQQNKSEQQQQDQKEQGQDKDQGQEQQQNQTEQNQNQEQENETKREQIEKEEAMSILKKLEGNEKQSFKNNERLLHNQNQQNSKNRW